MQKITINEGSFTLSQEFIDRSTHVYMLPTTNKSDIKVNLTINREKLIDTLSLDEYLNQQIRLMEKHLKKFQVLDKTKVVLGGAKIEGIMLESKFLGGAEWAFQRQAAFFIQPKESLIFTLSAKELTDSNLVLWNDWLASFELAR